MFYVKNLPNWERVVRLLASVAMAVCAYTFWGRPVGRDLRRARRLQHR